MTEPGDERGQPPEGTPAGAGWWPDPATGAVGRGVDAGGPWWPGPDPAAPPGAGPGGQADFDAETGPVGPGWEPGPNGQGPSTVVTSGGRRRGPAWWRSRRGVALLLAMVGAFGVGFGLTFARSGSPSAGSSNPGSTPSTTTPPGPTDPGAAVLRSVIVQQADVGPSLAVALIPGGDRVSGQTTLDLCNGTFASESARTARLQDAVADTQGNELMSTEAVLYHSAADTSQAFAELRSVAAHCPSGPVTSPVGEPTVTTRFNAAPDGAWPRVPGVDRLAYDFVSTGDTGQSAHGVAVYLRHGRLLLGVYFQSPDAPQPSVSGQTTIAGIVNLLAGRMAHASLTANT